MLTTSRPLRLPWAVWLAFVGVSIALGAATAALLGGEGRVSFTGVPQLQLPLPAAASPLPAGGAPRAGGEPGLIEHGAFGPLPRIAPDGRRPFLAYARPSNLEDARPRIALLVTGLGLQAELTAAALRLPGEISLQFSAYAADLPDWFVRARGAGHEVLLDLPMEPDYPASDPGPHTLLADNSTAENLRRLDWLLARAPGYMALTGGGVRFATSGAASPVLNVLARRGLALIEVGGADLAAAALAVGLPYASAPPALDQDPSLPSIDYALAGLEADALQSGSALGVARAYPVSLERLRLWAGTLADKGLVLAPVSALVIERAGLSAGFAGHGQAARRP